MEYRLSIIYFDYKLLSTIQYIQQMGKKVHLAVSDAEAKIKKLEQQLQKQSTAANKTKRKRLYSQLALLKKAIKNPEQLLVDPQEQAIKLKQDKQKRVQKKIQKKKQQILARKKQKRHQKRCLKCGSRQHLLSECTNTAVVKNQPTKTKKQIPKQNEEKVDNFSQKGGFCYKCGSTEHSHKDCAQQQYKLALCFYCGTKGHIARECQKNQKGLYRKGGSCFGCGSVRHILKDCPTRHGTHSKYNNKDQF